ncbi:MAG: cell division protein SepF, partial [Lachnospiraceae bacterium]|nr:cell division protein SepF [Lachnospiraceae bacterium]
VETLLENKTVLINFEGVDISISQRVLDIVTGACIAVGGNLQKISNFIFIATPASVDVSGEFQDALTGAFDAL